MTQYQLNTTLLEYSDVSNNMYNVYVLSWMVSLLFLGYVFNLFLKFYYNLNDNDNNFGDIFERMKYYEQQTNKFNIINNNTPFIVQLDGRNFKNNIATLKKYENNENNVNNPFSNKFQTAMLETAENLLHEFKCNTVFTFSDKFTLIFNESNLTSHMFGGKKNKLVSVISSYASVSLFNSLSKTHPQLTSDNKLFSFSGFTVTFPNDAELINYLSLKSFESSEFLMNLYSQKYIKKPTHVSVSYNDKMKYLQKIGYDFDSKAFDFKYGYFVKSDKFFSFNNTENSKSIQFIMKNISYSQDIYTLLVEWKSVSQGSRKDVNDKLNPHDDEIRNLIYTFLPKNGFYNNSDNDDAHSKFDGDD